MIRLRDYQQDAHRCIFKEWESVVSTLAVLPTGGGKTILFADVIRTMQPKRALVIAHREELIWQARDKITRVTGLECGIEMADLYVNSSLFGELPVVISTIQTQNSAWGDRKRMGRFRPSDFGVLICDECHHSTAQSYQNLFNYYKQNPDLKILGVTATPDRADEEALGQVFDTVAIDIEILDLIHSGWLVPIEQQFVHINGLDFSKMRTTCGDLNGADLASVMEAENNLQGVAGASVEIIKDRRAIVFTASVKQAEMLCDIFNRHKPNSAAWVCGATNKDARREMLGQFQQGQIQIVCNCVDEKTEILTRRGWVGHGAINEDDVTATLNLKTNQIEWQAISRIVKRHVVDGELMVSAKNQSINARVTEGHRMVWRSPGSTSWRVSKAINLCTQPKSYQLPVSGVDPTLVGVPLSDCELEFLGLFASDGHLNVKRASIEIAQAKEYSDNCIEIERILTGCHFDWRKTGTGDYWVYRIPKGNIGGALKRRGWDRLKGWLDKSLSPALSEMTVHQFERLMFGLWLGDGDKHYHRKKSRKNPGIRFCGVDWDLFDKVQAWASVRGYSSTLSIRPNTACGRNPNSILGHLSIKKREYIRTNNASIATSGGNPFKAEPIDHHQSFVWCVTNQNGTIITRRNGRVMVMGQCGVLTEGFDDPGVEVIIMARPTKSRSLYAQMCGRATRPLPGLVDDLDLPEHRRGAIENSPKPACLIVDFVGNSGRHKLMTSADILGGKVCDAAIERAIIKAKKSGQAVRMDDALDEEEENIRKMMEEARQREAARKARIVAKVSYTSQKISPFDALDLSPVKERGWDNNRTLSEKQKSLLLKQGVNPDTIHYAQARQLIAEMFRRWDHKLCSIKQATVLKKYGYETKNLGREDASKLLDALARNNWRRPAQTQHIPLMTKTEVPF